MLTRLDANGNTTSYQYDALNRLTQVSYQDATTDVYSYDSGTNGIGRLSSVSDASGTTTWSYDQHGRVTSKQQTVGAITLTTGYSYDAQGRLTQMTYPSGSYVDYSYTNGQLSGLSLNGTAIATNIQYQPFGPVSGWTWGNGTVHSRSFDLDGRLTQLSLGTGSRSIGYDDDSNITSLIDSIASQSFTYDELNRLTQSKGGLTDNGYQYDANGNRTQLTSNSAVTGYTIDGSSNRLLQVSDTTTRNYQYDANGNMLSDGLRSFTFNTNNRLVDVDGKHSYYYNALGQRVKKSVTETASGDANGDGVYDASDSTVVTDQILATGTALGDPDCTGDGAVDVRDLVCLNNLIISGAAPASTTSTTLFAYDESGHLIGEYDETGTAIRETVYLYDMPLVLKTSGSTYYIHTDQLGTPQQLTDSLGAVVWSAQYDPFGKAVVNEDPDGDGERVTFNQRFPGQYYDRETGLYYNYYRYYNSDAGRFVSSDPIGLVGGSNTYIYVRSDPMTWIDPLGLLGYMPNQGPPPNSLSDIFNAIKGGGDVNTVCWVTCRAEKVATCTSLGLAGMGIGGGIGLAIGNIPGAELGQKIGFISATGLCKLTVNFNCSKRCKQSQNTPCH